MNFIFRLYDFVFYWSDTLIIHCSIFSIWIESIKTTHTAVIRATMLNYDSNQWSKYYITNVIKSPHHFHQIFCNLCASPSFEMEIQFFSSMNNKKKLETKALWNVCAILFYEPHLFLRFFDIFIKFIFAKCISVHLFSIFYFVMIFVSFLLISQNIHWIMFTISKQILF